MYGGTGCVSTKETIELSLKAKEIGIDVSIQVLELSSFLQFTANGQHDMLIGLWYVSTGDADYGYYPLLHSSSAGAVGNRSFFANEELIIF